MTSAVAWDTCILIDAIQKTPGKWEVIAPILNQACPICKSVEDEVRS